MIPVSHLARNGMAPVAMGMVLCNDVNIDAYVNMVQGLHAEGVVSTPSGLTSRYANLMTPRSGVPSTESGPATPRLPPSEI